MNKHTAFVSGASGGIGEAIVMELAKREINLIIQYFNNESKIKQIITSLKGQKKINVLPLKIDLSDPSNLKSRLTNLPDKYFNVDVFIHCAATSISYRAFLQNNVIDFNHQMDITVNSFILLLQRFLPYMQKRMWGRVIGISSSLIHNVPTNILSSYITAKSALSGLCKALAVELAPYQITVNTISPGVTDTKFLNSFPKLMKELMVQKIPLRRLAKPRDISPAVGFLCSKSADFITGIDLPVAGGMVM